MADYWNHWLNMGRILADPPRIFRVNWFRRDEQGRFIWPGFGENMRVLKWIIDRVRGRGYAVEGPWGFMPRFQDIRWEGLDFEPEKFFELMSVDHGESALEVRSHEELFDKFFDRLPKEFVYHRELFKSRVWRSPEAWELARAIF